KTAVQKCHLYDPDLNPSYAEMARFYGTAIVPARPRHPKDKALVEGAVRLVMRTFRWLYRRHTFTGIHEINEALLQVTEKINNKPHTRFRVTALKFLASHQVLSSRRLVATERTTWEMGTRDFFFRGSDLERIALVTDKKGTRRARLVSRARSADR